MRSWPRVKPGNSGIADQHLTCGHIYTISIEDKFQVSLGFEISPDLK